jgi:asparagine synthase (glutamine-hydrolysing)
MCGIIGAINLNSTPLNVSRQDLLDSMSKMPYRGPDAQDTWQHASHPVLLGHLRLSILDPRPEGTQPMHLETVNGTYSIIYNGEVYNYLEIKVELENLGYRFITGTDTEVVLASFAAWGDDCVHRFNGMFAIAIYNDKTRKLSLFRDRVGVKPLYYKRTENGVIFASEVKAIIDLESDTPPMNQALLHQYMEYGYVSGEDTLHDGIKRLLPGHSLTLKDGEMIGKRYWNLSNKRMMKNSTPTMSFPDAVLKGRELFKSALELRLRADVPVGVFLSGGLDSSAVVAQLAQMLDHPVKTFSVRYDIGDYGEQYDESVYAKQVAEKFGTEHHTYTMTAADFEKYIPEFVKTMDEPVTEAAALSLHYVSELAKEHVTVVLSGEGSDEIFGGYDLYQYMETLEKIRKIATPAGANLIGALARKMLPQGNKIRKYAELTAQPFEERYKGISVYDGSYQKQLYQEQFKLTHPGHDFAKKIMAETQGQDLLSRMLEFDTRTWLVDDLLIKADRMSMGSSLELRVPFLDYRMVEFAASLPSHYKIKNGEGKYILKEMMKGLVPDNIIHREKRGFPTPLALMFQGPLKDYVTRTLLGDMSLPLIAKELFHHSEIKRLCEEHWAGKEDHHRLLWQLLVLEEWMKLHYSNGAV